MYLLKKPVFYLFMATTAAIIAIILLNSSYFNGFQRSGSLELDGLREQVVSKRDEKGMAYVFARNMDDLMVAQGFVTAQDRLFQMEATKLFASGRISEMVGEKGIEIDAKMRTFGFRRQAEKHAGLLSPGSRRFFQKYIDGVNEYIKSRSHTHPLEFSLAGLEPELWRIEDSLTILYYMGWGSAANIQTEIITKMLVDKIGIKKSLGIFPMTQDQSGSFDDEGALSGDDIASLEQLCRAPVTFGDAALPMEGDFALQVGSNSWAVGNQLSPSGKPILANDPHLDAGMLPGPWHPIGLFTPRLRSVGVNIPGIPGLAVFRNRHVAVGVTNAYGDSQDLFVETPDPKDPDRYLEGDVSKPYILIEETLKIKDKQSDAGFKTKKILIKATTRGPVISDVATDLKTGSPVSLRWSAFETMGPSVGLKDLLTSRSVDEVRKALKNQTVISLNCVFADVDGNIGSQVTGRLPMRAGGNGAAPMVVDGFEDNWTGWIPYEEMPQNENPECGWVGTFNHKTTDNEYPYYFSSRLAPPYRYFRFKQLIESPGKKTVRDHYGFQKDALNIFAQRIAPVMSGALARYKDTEAMAGILSDWDYHDSVDSSAPLIFQSVVRNFAWLVFVDELGEHLTKTMLSDWYFWQSRLEHMILSGKSEWFDNINTRNEKEFMDDMFHEAALKAINELSPNQSSFPKWGDVHTIEYVSPIRREGFGKGLLGGGSYPFPGSGETLSRGLYEFDKPFKVKVSPSLRMVADLDDNDKVMAVLPGGVSCRLFQSYTKNQIPSFTSGKMEYWWFSDEKIDAHAKHILTLPPKNPKG